MKKLLLACFLIMLILSVQAQIPVVSGGLGQTNENPNNGANGGNASGLGCGGGGANYYGGNGGDGMYGGGGGGAAGLNAVNMIGGIGGQGVLVVAFYNGGSFLNTIVYNNGTSLTVGALANSVKVWAIGAGGGGAGSTNNDGTVGGGGGAGGVAYITKVVTPGETITYSLGIGGTGGIDASNGINGGNTTSTIAGITITANGGAGGEYNNNIDALGGTYNGGDGGANGGDGKGSNGDTGGAGGGGIGGAIGGTSPGGGIGATGADAADVSGLFAALGSGSLLPVIWKNFTATSQKNEVILQWETSNEINTLDFTIQYSTNGINFENIGSVVAAGNSTNRKTYSYLHQNPLPVTGYYRLYQTDINGRSSFSGVVKNHLGSATENDFNLSTNMVINRVIKMQLNKSAIINLISLDGKIMYSRYLNKGLHYIEVNNISKGYYVLQSPNQSQKLLIQ